MFTIQIITSSTYPGSLKPLLQAWKEVRTNDTCITDYVSAIEKESANKGGYFFSQTTKSWITANFYWLKSKYNL